MARVRVGWLWALGLAALWAGLSACGDTGGARGPAVPDATRSNVKAAPQELLANGTDEVTVEITVRDVDGTPLADHALRLAVTGTGNRLSAREGRTAADGTWVTALQSLVAERKTLTVTVEGARGDIVLAARPVVEFLPARVPAELRFTAVPSSVAVGATILPPLAVSVVDDAGAVVADATLSIALGLVPDGEGPGGADAGAPRAQLLGTTVAPAVRGVATFANVQVQGAPGAYRLVARSPGVTEARSDVVDVQPVRTPALRFSVDAPPLSVAAVAWPTVVVELVDADGVRVPGADTTVTLGLLNAPGATLGGLTSVRTVNGVATFEGLSVDVPGDGYVLTALASGVPAAQGRAFSVTPAAGSRLRFVVDAVNTEAGRPFAPALQVAVEDAQGQRLTSATSRVTLTLLPPDGVTDAVLLGTSGQNAAAGLCTFASVAVNRAATGYSLRATAPGLGSATSAVFDVAAGTAASLRLRAPGITAPDPVPAGTPVTVELTAMDAFGNRQPAYAGTVVFTTPLDALGTTPPPVLLGAADLGQRTLMDAWVPRTAGTVELQATDGIIAGTLPLTVVPGMPSALVVEAAANQQVRVPPTPLTRARITDSHGNTVPQATHTVTLELAANPGAAGLLGTTSVAAVGGVATFADVSLSNEGSGFTLRATAPMLLEGTSAPFSVVDAVPPSAVMGLSVVAADEDSLTVRWNAPGDDGALGRAASYEVRRATFALDDQNFQTGTLVPSPPVPAVSGGVESMVVPGLQSNTGYHVAVRALDGPNAGPVASVMGTTTSCPRGYAGPACAECAVGFHRNAGNQCVDACTDPNPCSTAPAPRCQGNVALSPQIPGVCTLSSASPFHTCEYPETPTDCAAQARICVAGACIVDPCAGFTCTPPAARCEPDALTLTTYSSTCVADGPGLRHCEDAPATQDCSSVPGSVCFGAACVQAQVPTASMLLFTEVMHRPTTPQRAWLELTNQTDALLNVAGFTLADTERALTFVLPSTPVLVAPRGRLVLGQTTNPSQNGGITVNVAWGASFSLGTSGTLAFSNGANLVDQLTYNSGFPQVAGASMQLASVAMDPDAHTRRWYWCASTAALPNGGQGTPGAANNACGLTPPANVAACNLQLPTDLGAVDSGGNAVVYGRTTTPSVTTLNTAGNDLYPHLEAQVGLGRTGTSADMWAYAPAVFNSAYSTSGTADELVGSLSFGAAGAHAFGYRMRLLNPTTGAPGAWTYCDRNGVALPASGNWGTVSVRPTLTTVPTAPVPLGGTFTVRGRALSGTTGVTLGGAAQPFTVTDDTTLQVGPVADGTTVGTAALTVTAVSTTSTPANVTVMRLLISELDCDQVGSPDAAEFIEVSTGIPNVDLSGYTLVLVNGSNDLSYRAIALGGLTNAAGLATVAAAAFMPTPTVAVPGVTTEWLQQGADAVALYQGNINAFPVGVAAPSTGLLDLVVYDNGNASDDAALLALFPGMDARVQVAETQTTSIQRCSPVRMDGRAFTGTHAPTPAAANTCP